MRAWKLLLVPAVPVLAGVAKPALDALGLRRLRRECPELFDGHAAARVVNALCMAESLRLVSEQDAARSW